MDYEVKQVVFLWRKTCGVCDLGDEEREYRFVLFFVFLCIGNVVIFVKWHNVKQAYLPTSLHDNDNYSWENSYRPWEMQNKTNESVNLIIVQNSRVFWVYV